MEIIVNELTCSTCLEFNCDKYFINFCGHIICDKCKNLVDKCPLCRTRIHYVEAKLLKNISTEINKLLESKYEEKIAELKVQIAEMQSNMSRIWIKKRKEVFDPNCLANMSVRKAIIYILSFDKHKHKITDKIDPLYRQIINAI